MAILLVLPIRNDLPALWSQTLGCIGSVVKSITSIPASFKTGSVPIHSSAVWKAADPVVVGLWLAGRGGGAHNENALRQQIELRVRESGHRLPRRVRPRSSSEEKRRAETMVPLSRRRSAAWGNGRSEFGPSPTAGNDPYEAFLFSLVLKAARSEGYDISFADGSGRMPTEFRLRRSPGRLSTGTFTHAILTLLNTTKVPLEVHAGVAMIGKSKVAHEADILVLRASSATRRLHWQPPPVANACTSHTGSNPFPT